MLFFTLEAKLSALKSLVILLFICFVFPSCRKQQRTFNNGICFFNERPSTTPSLLKSDFNKLVIACFNLKNYTSDITLENGVCNTGNRIAGIGGEITFETQAEQGLKIHIHFPIAKKNI